MNKYSLITLLVTMFTLNAAFADEGQNNLYIGAKKSDLSIDLSAYTDGDTTGVLVGYSLSPTSAIELEKSKYNVSLLGFDTDVDIFAVYYAVRTQGEKYLKYKLGYLKEDISNSIVSESDTGFSYGIGGGFNFGDMNLELEYIKVEQDVSSTNLNFIFNF